MKSKKARLCVYVKDIQWVTGRSERHSRRIMNNLRQALGKASFQEVTVEELAHYLGIPADAIRELLD